MIVSMILAAAMVLADSSAGTDMPARAQKTLLKDWALARCIAKGAPKPFAEDASTSAAAILEHGDYGIDTYNAIDRLVVTQLAKRYGGSVPGEYITLKCLDLYHGAALDALIRRQKPTPVR